MSQFLSSNFGALEYDDEKRFSFPGGLPGFPEETAFLPVEIPEQFPLLYLQSLRTPELCFVTLPVRCVVSDYELAACVDDMTQIGLGPDARPGPTVLCLALICFDPDGTAAANLRAPILVNVTNRLAVQTIQYDDQYPIRYPLNVGNETAPC
jgi:flagellar assembly factor FliW